MSLMQQWQELTDNQTEATIDAFWKEYCDAEIKIYSDIISRAERNGEDVTGSLKGNFGELVEQFGVDPVIFMGFIDGVHTSLVEGTGIVAGKSDIDLESIDESSDIDLTIDMKKLNFNMLKADAKHLYGIEGWLDLLTEDELKQIVKDFRKSGTVVKGKKIGRNDPCPCGSGKKYKHCCGKNA